MATFNTQAVQQDNDINLVELWLRRDPKRWIAGLLAGLFAGIVMIVFAMILAKLAGMELWFPVKFAALPFLGNVATAYDAGALPILVGFVFLEALTGFLGVLYAHFAPTNSLSALLGVGFVWGAFSWIFLFCLYMQSWNAISAAQVPPSAAFPVTMVFGFALTSVAFFDRMIRGHR